MTKDFMKFTLKSGGFHPWNLADFTQISPVKSTQNYKSKCFSKNSSVWWMQGRGYDQGFDLWNPAEFTLKSGRFDLWNPVQISPRYHLWNPRKIIKASVSAKTLQFDECRVGNFTLKSGGFHPWNLADFTQISPVKSTQNYKSKCFNKNSSVWWMQGGGCDQGFHEVLPDFTWNPHEIHQISWNPPDFKIMSFCVMIKYRSFVFQKTNQKSFCWNIWFYKVWGGFHLKSAGFHEICRISPEIRWISWNPPDLKSAGFYEIRRISWNPADFMWNWKTFARNCNSMFQFVFIRIWRRSRRDFSYICDKPYSDKLTCTSCQCTLTLCRIWICYFAMEN